MQARDKLQMALAPWGETLDELTSAASAAEAAGFHSVWTSELHRTSFLQAAAIAAKTTTIQIGTAATLAFVRSPMITALSALDLDEISNGRFILGLGTGVQRLNENWHGATFGKPAKHLLERAQLIRKFIAESHLDRSIEFEGEFVRASVRGFERPFKPVRETIPIFVAAVGPIMTRTAGEVGDGWIAHELGSVKFLKERILPNLEQGLHNSTRNTRDFTVVASAVCVPHSDAAQARRRAAGLVAFYATVRTYNEFFSFHGFEDEARKIQEHFRAGDIELAVKSTPDEMVDALTFAGTPDDVRARVARYEGVADVVKLSPPTHFVAPEVTREVQIAILRTFGG